MLSRRHRIAEGDDYRLTARRGARAGADGLLAYAVLHDDPTTPTRFGFIITKRVGVAVVRNRTRRRLKAIAAEQLAELGPGLDIVIRVNPEAADMGWDALRESGRSAIRRAARRARDEGRRLPPRPAARQPRSGPGGASAAPVEREASNVGASPAPITATPEPAA